MTITYFNFVGMAVKKLFSTFSMGFVFYLLLVVCAISSCQTTYTDCAQLPKKQLIIGTYGGFTGLDFKHIYLKNGSIYTVETVQGSKPKLSYVNRQTKTQAYRMYRTAKKISFPQVACNEPANINSYIEFKRHFRNDQYYQLGGLLDSTDKNFKAIKKLMQWQH